jgi:2-phospho-L-lactate guanylyltransferase
VDEPAKTEATMSSLDGREVILIPVKAFTEAKVRLAAALDADARAALARQLAEGVIRAAAHAPVAVVCDDEQVSRWANDLGALVIWAPGKGLNRAVAFGVSELEALGASRITVVHGDILDPSGLGELPAVDGILLVPDLREDGTNIISLPAGADFEFAYGPGSFHRHRSAAVAAGHDVMVLRDVLLGHDVDRPSDLPRP